MEQREQLQLIGEVFLDLYDEQGKLKDSRYSCKEIGIHNLITDAGFDVVSNYMGQGSPRPAATNYTAIGSGTVAAATGDTALGFEFTGGRLTGTYTHTNGTKTYTMVTSFPPGTGTGGVTESGMLNASAAGTLLNRQTFAVVNKAAGDTLQTTWTITLS